MNHSVQPNSARRRAARLRSGEALFGAFAQTIRLLRWLLIGLLAIYLCSGITRVGPHEDALVYRLGKLQREIHSPGLLIALPPPLDRVVRVPTRTQHEIFILEWSGDEESMEQTTAIAAAAANVNQSVGDGPPKDKGLHPAYNGYSVTGDANVIQARFTVRYRIVDPFAYLMAAQTESVNKLIETAALDAATKTLAGMKIDAALSSGVESFRSQVLAAAQARLDKILPGVNIVAFEVNSITPPLAAAAAFADVTSAQVEARTTVEKARTYQAQTLPNARGEAFRTRAQADAEARQLTSRANAEAASFAKLATQHAANPALIEMRLRAETLDAVLPQMKSRTVLPDATGTVDLFLPSK